MFGAVTLGSAIGCMLDYAVGRWLGRTEERWTRGRLARFRPQIDELVARFARHGGLYIAINRFIPSLRGALLRRRRHGPAALVGGAGVRHALGALVERAPARCSALTVGKSWDRLVSLFATYGLVVLGRWLRLAVVARWWCATSARAVASA